MQGDQSKIARNIDNHLKNLRCFTSTDVGVTRLPFTKEAKAASHYLAEAMKEYGLTVRQDASGAVIGRLEGKSAETIVIGSHYDSVKHGGAFDGIAGVICGMEIARLFIEANEKPFYSLEIVGTNDEEGVRFGDGFFSSKAFLGLWDTETLKSRTDSDGISIYQAMKTYGLIPEKIHEAKWCLEKIKGFWEIHCEQGPVLEAVDKEIGIVTGIVGMRRYLITIQGQADHAGTTPMPMRKDALVMAAQVVTKVEEIGLRYESAVATVGFCEISPNVVNTVAQTVRLSLDIRSIKQEDIQHIEDEILAYLARVVEQKGATYEVQQKLDVQPVLMDAQYQQQFEQSCTKLGYSFHYLHSGAGHDALQLGTALPVMMVFVPSKGGRSHCPEEFTDSQHLAAASLCVYNAIINLA